MRTRIISAAVLIAAISIGCSTKEALNQNDNLDGSVNDGHWTEVLHAVLPEEFISTKLTYSNGQTIWETTDYIAVCIRNTQTGAIQYSKGTSLGAGNFGFAYDPTIYVRDYYAIYPNGWQDSGNYGNPDLSVTLPIEYDYSLIKSPALMVGMVAEQNDSKVLQFKQFCGCLRLTVTGVPSDTDAISIVFDKCITGSFVIENPDGSKPAISVNDSGLPTEVTVYFDSPTTTENGSYEFNIPMPAGQYSTIAGAALDVNGGELATGNAAFNQEMKRTTLKTFTLALSAVSSNPIGGVTTTPMDVVTIDIQDGNHNNTWN